MLSGKDRVIKPLTVGKKNVHYYYCKSLFQITNTAINKWNENFNCFNQKYCRWLGKLQLEAKDDIIQIFAPSSYSQPPPSPWSIQVLLPDPAGDKGGSAPQLCQGSSACSGHNQAAKCSELPLLHCSNQPGSLHNTHNTQHGHGNKYMRAPSHGRD